METVCGSLSLGSNLETQQRPQIVSIFLISSVPIFKKKIKDQSSTKGPSGGGLETVQGIVH